MREYRELKPKNYIFNTIQMLDVTYGKSSGYNCIVGDDGMNDM